jgi:hypothetical protein
VQFLHERQDVHTNWSNHKQSPHSKQKIHCEVMLFLTRTSLMRLSRSSVKVISFWSRLLALAAWPLADDDDEDDDDDDDDDEEEEQATAAVAAAAAAAAKEDERRRRW